MRRESVVATAALIAALALAGLPGPAGSRSPSSPAVLEPAAFTSVVVPADIPAPRASGSPDDALAPDNALRSAGYTVASGLLIEPGAAPKVPTSRPSVTQPASTSGSAWKKPKSTISGYASFYDNGTTAMRLPRGTVVRICGKGGCIERTVTDYGPVKKIRVVDMYRPDFFRICGCAGSSGTTWVTVSIY